MQEIVYPPPLQVNPAKTLYLLHLLHLHVTLHLMPLTQPSREAREPRTQTVMAASLLPRTARAAAADAE